MNGIEELRGMMERVEGVFEDVREFTRELKEDELRSHRERERMLSEWLEEARRIRELLERQNELLERIVDAIDEAREKVRNFLL